MSDLSPPHFFEPSSPGGPGASRCPTEMNLIFFAAFFLIYQSAIYVWLWRFPSWAPRWSTSWLWRLHRLTDVQLSDSIKEILLRLEDPHMRWRVHAMEAMQRLPGHILVGHVDAVARRIVEPDGRADVWILDCVLRRLEPGSVERADGMYSRWIRARLAARCLGTLGSLLLWIQTPPVVGRVAQVTVRNACIWFADRLHVNRMPISFSSSPHDCFSCNMGALNTVVYACGNVLALFLARLVFVGFLTGWVLFHSIFLLLGPWFAIENLAQLGCNASYSDFDWIDPLAADVLSLATPCIYIAMICSTCCYPAPCGWRPMLRAPRVRKAALDILFKLPITNDGIYTRSSMEAVAPHAITIISRLGDIDHTVCRAAVRVLSQLPAKVLSQHVLGQDGIYAALHTILEEYKDEKGVFPIFAKLPFCALRDARVVHIDTLALAYCCERHRRPQDRALAARGVRSGRESGC